jgi:hypothetical protein
MRAVMSATEDLNIVYKCLSEGADDYLLKVCKHCVPFLVCPRRHRVLILEVLRLG